MHLIYRPPAPFAQKRKKQLHNHITVVPREIEDNGYAKFWKGGGGLNKVHYGLGENGECHK